MGWKIRHKGLADAIDFYGLVLPVRIRPTNQTRTRGRYKRGRTAVTQEHYITLAQHLSAEEANRVLMHELAHAEQWERAHLRDIPGAKAAYNADRRVPVWARKCEQEAREMEALADEIEAIVPEWWMAGLDHLRQKDAEQHSPGETSEEAKQVEAHAA